MREIALETENPSCEGTVLHHEEGMNLLPSNKLLTGMELWLQTVDENKTVLRDVLSRFHHTEFRSDPGNTKTWLPRFSCFHPKNYGSL